MDGISDRPLSGFGLGTFEKIFSSYRDDTVTVWFKRAHSDYLELTLTAGIPATLLLLLVFFTLIVYLICRLSTGTKYSSFIALGITSSIQLAIHSLVDFPLQIPAVSFFWCAILAASIAIAYKCESNVVKN